MSIQEMERVLKDLEQRGLVSASHLFIVRNREQHESKRQWVPVPGDVVCQFLSGSHDHKYLGPNDIDDKSVQGKLKRLDAVNKGLLQFEDLHNDAVEVPSNEPEEAEEREPVAASRSSKKTGDKK